MGLDHHQDGEAAEPVEGPDARLGRGAGARAGHQGVRGSDARGTSTSVVDAATRRAWLRGRGARCPLKHRVLLAILDGWGVRAEREDNAILLAGTPNLDRFAGKMPRTELLTSGLAVGLPEGQMGNSEVGHTNIGAGRIVYQDLVRINRAVEPGELAHNPALVAAMDTARSSGKALHLMGLIGPGGVHASQEHLLGLLKAAKTRGVARVFVHAFLDGRDTPPMSALGYLEELERFLRETGTGRIATVIGRFYAMDRDKRWDRVQQAYDAMVRGVGQRAPGAVEAVRASYAEKVGDEFVHPTVIVDGDTPVATVRDGDTVIFFNFRADRARELTRALAVPGFHEFDRGGLRLGRYVCMTQYDETFDLPVAFPPEQPREIFAEVLAENGPDPVPHRRDREVRARHVLLQRRSGGGVSRRGAGADPQSRAT